jgi:hypothetical protein
MKTKVGHEWSQLPALSLLFRYLIFILFKGTPSFKVDEMAFNL